MPTYSLHPAVEIFPAMDESSFAGLVEDIRVNGQLEPILMWRGQVIDGRNRLNACEQLGIEPKIREVDSNEDDLIGLVLSLNLHRRHLSESQRAMIGARIASMRRGRPQTNPPIGGFSQAEAAQQLHVGERSLQRARQVLDHGVHELSHAVDQGSLAVSTAAKIAKLPEETQREVLTRSPEELRKIARDVQHRIHDTGVAGRSALKVFDHVVSKEGLSGSEQMAVVEAIKAETTPLPSPTEAERLAKQGEPGLLILATDGRYHTAPGDPADDERMQRWLILRSGLEVLGTLPFQADQAQDCIPSYQKENVTAWLDRAEPFLRNLGQLWRKRHA
jgi:ParB-like chromosome segregation protein Spo0J